MGISAEKRKQLEEQFKDVPQEGRVLFEVRATFSDSGTGLHYGKGIYPLRKEVADRFHREKRGRFIDASQAPKEEEAGGFFGTPNEAANLAESESRPNEDDADDPNTETTSLLGKDKEVEKTEDPPAEDTPLPQRFPERQILVDLGIDTIEKLEALSEDDLKAKPGIAQAKATRIGIALAEFRELNPK